MKPRASTVGLRAAACVLAGLVPGVGCGGTSVTVQPDGKALSTSVSTIVELPVFLGFGLPGEQRRVQRRTGDSLIALAGGHAVLAEELPVHDDRDLTDQEIAQAVRGVGEDPARAITFSLVASRNKRTVANASPIPGFQMGRRMVLDYNVRLEVRQVGRADVIGTVD